MLVGQGYNTGGEAVKRRSRDTPGEMMTHYASMALALSLATASIAYAEGGERGKAIAAIEKLGGKVEYDDEPGQPIRLVRLEGGMVTDKELALLKALPDLRILSLRDAN